MPQISRLAALFLLVAVGFVVARHYLKPKTFGDIGHFRAAAIDADAAKPLVYAGREECALCHPDEVSTHDSNKHRNVACEVCHGAALAHTENPVDVRPRIPRDRSFCPLCHSYNAGRPTGFPQIDPVSHNPMQVCITCHKPHAPEPPRVPQECSACHGEIAKTKLLSKHANVECTSCHNVEERHKTAPAASKPTKPQSRDVCLTCHSLEAKSSRSIPRVDGSVHWTRYDCWQCHYSHYPEAK